jgi:light-regulated signal transduction histidine kinase (bacteriophytochrome)
LGNRSKDEKLKSGKGVIILSIIAGVATWISNAIVERLYYYGSTRSFWDLLLLDIPPEEFYDRIITMAAFLLLGIIVARMLEKRIASEARLKDLAAELERSNSELEQFAYMASHDLKEPLVTVGGYLRLLERRHRQALDENATGYLRNALEGIRRLEQLIGDLLSYSRAGSRGKEFRPVDPSAILDTALANLSGVIETRNAVVTRDPLFEVMADGTQFLQLFQNLISNGIKFCRDPSPRIHVAALRNDKNETVFSVRDNGIGIAPEHTEEIFLVFRRLHDRKKFPGTGVGLATCKKIVERHGGRIWVESSPGEGATFLFTVPDRGIPP